MLALVIEGQKYDVNWVEFSDGALTCKVENLPREADYIWITVDPSTPCKQVIEELELLWDALNSVNYKGINLNMPYLPYARADRKFEDGNPEPLALFLFKLAALPFDDILIADVHNPESLSPDKNTYTSNIKNKSQLECFKDSLPSGTNMRQWSAVISPDKGAVLKAHTVADYLKVPVLCADKERDISTGRITKTTLPDIGIKTPNPRVLICDDIFDGGGTFIPLCEELGKRDYKVDLYITHLIAAKGLDILKGLVDNIYFYHVVGNYINDKHVLDFNNK